MPIEVTSHCVYLPGLPKELPLLPNDLDIEIQHYLRPEDKVNLVLAVYNIPAGYKAYHMSHVGKLENVSKRNLLRWRPYDMYRRNGTNSSIHMIRIPSVE